MSNSDIEHRVESYFSSLNSMANRIMVEREWAKKGVDVSVWSRMTNDDRTRFFSDSLIGSSSEVNAKYAYCLHSKPDVESFPKLDVRSGEKYIVVDEGEQGGTIGSSTWRDEHSGPFTWETQSQLDLSFGNGDAAEKKKKSKEEDGNLKHLSKPSPPSDSFEVYRTKKMEKQINGKCFDKPRAPAPPPPPPSNNNNKQSNKVNQMKCPPPKPPPKGKSPNAVLMNELESVVFKKVDTGDNDNKKKKTKQNRVSGFNREVSLPSRNSNEVVVHNPTKPMKSEAASKSDMNKTVRSSMNDLTLSVDLSPGEDSDIPKTGFDFLDNW